MKKEPGHIKNIFWNISNVLVSGVSLFLVYRYLLKTIGAEQLGIWSVVLAGASIAKVSELGMGGSITKFVATYRAEEKTEKAAVILETAFLSVSLIMGAIVVLSYPLFAMIVKWAVPIEQHSKALELLPWGLASIWFSTTMSIPQAGLDACSRFDQRNKIQIIMSCSYVGALVVVVPRFGLLGIAYCQVMQSMLTAAISYFLLRRNIRELRWVPTRWSYSHFREIIPFAATVQLGTLSALFFEPITKAMLSKWGGLSAAAYYEMASQMIAKFRAVMIAANQVITPIVSRLNVVDSGEILWTYTRHYRLTWAFSVPAYTILLIFLYPICQFWIGAMNSVFIEFCVALSVGYWFATINGPAYFTNLGTGDAKSNTLSLLVTGVINPFSTYLLGSFYGGTGVVLGSVSSLVFGAVLLIYMFHQKMKIGVKSMMPSESKVLLVISIVAAVAAGEILGDVDAGDTILNTTAMAAVLVGIYSLAVVYIIRRSDLGELIFGYLVNKNR
jgi:O-antigen/teichoic acid export membrane protein